MFTNIRGKVKMASEFSEAMTKLQTVLQGLSDEDVEKISAMARSFASISCSTATAVVYECIDELLRGKGFEETHLGNYIYWNERSLY